MTNEQRAKCAEEIAAAITAVVRKHTTSDRAGEPIWKCSPEDLPLPGEDDISAILARHDTATVGDAARAAARECIGIDGCVAWLDEAAAIIQRAISASERELVEVAWSLVNNLPDSELELARENWGNTNVAVVKHWRDEVRVVLAKRGKK